MVKKMLIDTAQAEEVRVAIVQGNRVEDFEFESSLRKQLKGNIYLAKVTRIEPSLQAAFVDYGGNRHGFLPLSEIHPDYYQIPAEDREALLADEAREAAEAQAEEDAEEEALEAKPNRRKRAPRRKKSETSDEAADEATGESAEGAAEETSDEAPAVEADVSAETEAVSAEAEPEAKTEAAEAVAPDTEGTTQAADVKDEVLQGPSEDEPAPEAEAPAKTENAEAEGDTDASADATASENNEEESEPKPRNRRRGGRGRRRGKKTDTETVEGAEETAVDAVADATPSADAESDADADADAEVQPVETTGGEGDEDEAHVARRRTRRRHYRIQEVIRPRQILLVQVVKEERGTKGAALTTYLSLAGRYGVLMPNTARGGGISRKISNREDRKRLKGIVRDLEVSKGMGLIVRTAGAQRTRQEIKRDYDYLIRLWDQIRELTLKSVAPCLIYEEGSLLLRAIRDFYSKDVESVLVQGDAGYKEAKGYMKLLMPSHAKNVQQYKDDVPLFQRYQVDSQLEQMIEPEVQLKSGGYLVINPTEALVSIDINSGRSTREKNIEQTALRTNLEAAEEIARQLRLRDLAGLVVIDFIDMDENRNNKAVERKMKDCLSGDRARIQVGRISQFGLLEMSRQRLGSSLLETATRTCTHCEGSGLLRTDDSAALSALRRIEEEALRGKASEISVNLHPDIALYLLNHKRDQIALMEERHGMRIIVAANSEKRINECVIERLQTRRAERDQRRQQPADRVASAAAMEMDEPEETAAKEEVVETTQSAPAAEAQPARDDATQADGEPKKRRRGRRGGRKRNRNGQEGNAEANNGEAAATEPSSDKPEVKEIEITEPQETAEPVAEIQAKPEPKAEPKPKPAAKAEATPVVEESKAEEEAPKAPPPLEEQGDPAQPTRKGWWQGRFGK